MDAVIKPGPYGRSSIVRHLHHKTWELRCHCGRLYTARECHIRKGQYKACSDKCKKPRQPDPGPETDLGNFDFVESSVGDDGRTYWTCRCRCEKGTLVTRRSRLFLVGDITSCGCGRKRENRSVWTGHGDISGSFFYQLRANAALRKLPYEVEDEYLWNLFLKQDRKCALTGWPVEFHTFTEQQREGVETTASLDRIDSTKGYVVGNVWWVHKEANILKSFFPLKYLIKMCRLVVARADAGLLPFPEGCQTNLEMLPDAPTPGEAGRGLSKTFWQAHSRAARAETYEEQTAWATAAPTPHSSGRRPRTGAAPAPARCSAP